MKKILITFLIMSLIFVIYYSFSDTKIYYLALGDGIALGETPYDSYGYSYADYLKDYLNNKNELEFYTKNFTKEDLRIEDLIKNIENNQTIFINNQTISINEALDKADILTLSIGSSDFYYKLKLNNLEYSKVDIKTIMHDIDEIFIKLDICFNLIRRYFDKEMYVTGFYNPITNKEYINNEILDNIFKYTNDEFEKLSKKYHFRFIEINSILGNNKNVLPNPNNVHLNYLGQKLIGQEIISNLTNQIRN